MLSCFVVFTVSMNEAQGMAPQICRAPPYTNSGLIYSYSKITCKRAYSFFRISHLPMSVLTLTDFIYGFVLQLLFCQDDRGHRGKRMQFSIAVPTLEVPNSDLLVQEGSMRATAAFFLKYI